MLGGSPAKPAALRRSAPLRDSGCSLKPFNNNIWLQLEDSRFPFPLAVGVSPSQPLQQGVSSLDEETAAVSYTYDHWWRYLEFTVPFVSILTAACQILQRLSHPN